MHTISIVVATDSKRGIGKNGKLPWHIPEELKYFHKVTDGHPIIMGRKTFESIGHVLSGRTNIIVTRDVESTKNSHPELVSGSHFIVSSLEEAISEAKKAPGSETICIIGGGQIFELALPLTDKLYITVVEGDFGADTFFPDYSEFKKVVSEEQKESSGFKYKLLVLER